MADRTKVQEQKLVDESLKQLQETSEKHGLILSDLSKMMAAISLKLDQSTTTKTWDSNNGGSTSTNWGLNNNHTGKNSIQTRFSKLNFPKFEVENPSGWIYKFNLFFNINGIVEEEKIELASINLEGHALEWFQGYEVGHENINWESFSTDVVARFGPSAYDSPVG